MNTEDINTILSTNSVTKDTFLGVFALDELPKSKLMMDRWFLVCNCCPISLPGEHWVLMFYENDEIQFFDSFGKAPDFYNGMERFILEQNPGAVSFNPEQFQSFGSDACGHYCVLVGYMRSAGETMEAVTSNLRRLDRDSFLKYIVNNLI